MVSRLKFPSRLVASNHQGHWNEGTSGFVDGRLSGVGRKLETVSAKARGNPTQVALESTGEKSCVVELYRCPYRKPTQVGEASSLR